MSGRVRPRTLAVFAVLATAYVGMVYVGFHISFYALPSWVSGFMSAQLGTAADCAAVGVMSPVTTLWCHHWTLGEVYVLVVLGFGGVLVLAPLLAVFGLLSGTSATRKVR